MKDSAGSRSEAIAAKSTIGSVRTRNAGSNPRDANGRCLEVIEVPLGANLSHMNFYIAHSCVLVPVTRQKCDNTRAMAILQDVVSDRIDIDSQILADESTVSPNKCQRHGRSIQSSISYFTV